ncbi:MAG: PAS domain-containing protein [Dechloromonas sp.]|uniref:PAS domain-containing protein n=1 Tax=Candidatus Dechloromonas phosphorivorans TaxID=2899244 RepID=A0A935KBD0_9RHOO|nr:PAS domain-containing protein [Candidatus Dechloromonas phosphorivorans]
MRELNRDFVAFLENTSDFIYFKDKSSRFRFCSQTMAKITGHASWRDMIGKHDREVFPEETAKIYSEEEPTSSTTEFHCWAGWIRISMRPATRDG